MFVNEHTPMLACDRCGALAAAHIGLERGWRAYYCDNVLAGHHCPNCVVINEHIASGLVYHVDPRTAVVYVANGHEHAR